MAFWVDGVDGWTGMGMVWDMGLCMIDLVGVMVWCFGFLRYQLIIFSRHFTSFRFRGEM
jgi:hypothetical protein